MHGHWVKLNRLRLLNLSLIWIRLSRNCSHLWTLILLQPLVVNLHVVSSVAFIIILIAHHLLVLNQLLIISRTQLLDCVILLMVQNLLRLLLGYFDLHVLKGILQIRVLLLLVYKWRNLLSKLIVTNYSSLPRDLFSFLGTIRHFCYRLSTYTGPETRNFWFDMWVFDVFIWLIIRTAANLSSTLWR